MMTKRQERNLDTIEGICISRRSWIQPNRHRNLVYGKTTASGGCPDRKAKTLQNELNKQSSGFESTWSTLYCTSSVDMPIIKYSQILDGVCVTKCNENPTRGSRILPCGREGRHDGVNTFTAIVDLSRFNNSCLKSPASTLVDLTFQSRALRSFSLK